MQKLAIMRAHAHGHLRENNRVENSHLPIRNSPDARDTEHRKKIHESWLANAGILRERWFSRVGEER